jgi:hypothetical protein
MIEDHNFRTGGSVPVAIHLRPTPADPESWWQIVVRGSGGQADTSEILAPEDGAQLPIEGEA